LRDFQWDRRDEILAATYLYGNKRYRLKTKLIALSLQCEPRPISFSLQVQQEEASFLSFPVALQFNIVQPGQNSNS
jgi:hypothetical protein